jgi:hypothetical protein
MDPNGIERQAPRWHSGLGRDPRDRHLQVMPKKQGHRGSLLDRLLGRNMSEGRLVLGVIHETLLIESIGRRGISTLGTGKRGPTLPMIGSVKPCNKKTCLKV